MLKSLHRLEIKPGLLVLEAFVIILGVMLGFGVNEWRQQRADEQRTERALRSMAAEMTLNHGQLSGRLAYYRRILAGADSLRAAGAELGPGLQALPGWRGAAPPLVRSASWAAAQATGAFERMDFATAEALANVYTLQGFLESMARTTVETWSSGVRLDVEAVLRSFNVFCEIGPELLQAYEQVGAGFLAGHGWGAVPVGGE
jgi:hypothetical protein